MRGLVGVASSRIRVCIGSIFWRWGTRFGTAYDDVTEIWRGAFLEHDEICTDR